MGKPARHDVGVADSYVRRTADDVILTLHLPETTDVHAGGVRLTSLGKGAKRRVDVTAQAAPARTGVLVTASVPRADIEPGRWQLRLRTADGAGYQRVRARLMVRPDQPVALLVGPAPQTRMVPPKPRGTGPTGGPPATRTQAVRRRLRGAARRARRLMPSR